MIKMTNKTERAQTLRLGDKVEIVGISSHFTDTAHDLPYKIGYKGVIGDIDYEANIIFLGGHAPTVEHKWVSIDDVTLIDRAKNELVQREVKIFKWKNREHYHQATK